MTTPAVKMPCNEGTVYTNADGHVVKQTYLFTGKEIDPDGPDLYRFVVWQGDLIFRTRLTEGEVQRKQLVEKPGGLDFYQKANVARMLFRYWQAAEDQSVEIHKLKEAAR